VTSDVFPPNPRPEPKPTLRYWVYDQMDGESEGNPVGRVFELSILTLIALNVIAMMVETVDEIGGRYAGFFRGFEIFSVAVFTIEYILRLWTCVEEKRYAHPVLGRIKYALSPAALIDLVAILPFYLPFSDLDLRFVRILRLMRLFRVLKVGRYSEAIQLVFKVITVKRGELLSTFFMLSLVLILSGSLIWVAERDAQPDKFASIPASLWWAIVTITTVGYGDVFPITPIGKILTGFVAIAGVLTVALPTGIFAAGFMELMAKKPEEKPDSPAKTCPHCGKPIEA
jgi:voltage-gated potassium channel